MRETISFTDIDFTVRVEGDVDDKGRALWINVTAWQMHGRCSAMGDESFTPHRPMYYRKGEPFDDRNSETFEVDEAPEYLSGVLKWDADFQWQPGEAMNDVVNAGTRREMIEHGVLLDRIYAIARVLCPPRPGEESWTAPAITTELVERERAFAAELEEWNKGRATRPDLHPIWLLGKRST